MNIAIDYDGTYSADPFLFNAFIGLARHQGHQCFIVTGRKESEAPSAQAGEIIAGIRVICCNGELKEKACMKRGIKIDVWIDDAPRFIQESLTMPEDKDL